LKLVSGRYQLQRRLADEASSTAWLAYDTALDRRVLIKLLRADLVDGQPDAAAAVAESFRRDVRAAARATSASAARVLDAGDDQTTGVPFVVFEWTDGSPHGFDEQLDRDAQAATHVIPSIAPRHVVMPRRAGFGVERLVLLLLVIPATLGALLIGNWLSQPASVSRQLFTLPSEPAATAPTASIVPAGRPTSVEPTPRPQPTATTARPQPTATPAPETGERRRVANTDGIGVALRATAGGDRLPGKGYDEGATVTLLEQQGAWSRIRGDDGREGWVLSVTLVR
jgi:Bacterial SH3 domain